jgi:hypothetical protein
MHIFFSHAESEIFSELSEHHAIKHGGSIYRLVSDVFHVIHEPVTPCGNQVSEIIFKAFLDL